MKSTKLRYTKVAHHLRDQIQGGELRPGDRLPSFRDLRRQHHVAQCTIDKAYAVLEGEGLIARTERSGVFVAQPATRRATGLIGFCNIEFTKSNFTPFWTDLLEGVEAAAHASDRQVLLLKAGVAAGWEKVDGLLFNGLVDRIPVSRLPMNLPMVSLFVPPLLVGSATQRRQTLSQTSLIATDDYQAMRNATEYLLGLGHRRIAYLNNSNSDKRVYPQRLAGYQDALRAAKIKPDQRWLRALARPTPKIYFMSSGRLTMSQWLQEDWHELGCTALLTQNDDTAWGAIEAFRQEGIKVPEDVSIVGFDGTQSAEICNPQLTTVEVPLQQMGYEAVQMLLRRIHDSAHPVEKLTFSTQLRMRASTASPRHLA